MIKIEASLYRLVNKSKRFFERTRYLHIVMAVLMLVTGISALVLSLGSNGTAEVPYYFSAFISGVWHIVFLVLCQVCVYFLSDDCRRSSSAGSWVRAYSIVSSIFVLFNVMGVVFTVVNGMCTAGQMCYYDKHLMANRAMAILLTLEHCVSVISSVFLAKRAHVIDSELNEDVSIKLNLPFDFLERLKSRKRTESVEHLELSRSEQTTPSGSIEQKETGLSNVVVKDGHVLTTIEISAMSRKTHRRTKSQPNMIRQLDLKPPELEGQVYSIYSDSETKMTEEEKRKKKRFIPSKRKLNRIDATIHISAIPRVNSKSRESDEHGTSEDESLSATLSIEETKTKLRKYKKNRKNNKSRSSHKDQIEYDAEDARHVKPVSADKDYDKQQALLEKQEKLQKDQEKLFEEQRKMFLVQQQRMNESSVIAAPPPYEQLSISHEDRNIRYVEPINKNEDANDESVV